MNIFTYRNGFKNVFPALYHKLVFGLSHLESNKHEEW